jgi:cytochrome c6
VDKSATGSVNFIPNVAAIVTRPFNSGALWSGSATHETAVLSRSSSRIRGADTMNGPSGEWRPRTWWQWLLVAAFPIVLAAFIGLIISSVQGDDDGLATGTSSQTTDTDTDTDTETTPTPSQQFVLPGVVGESYELAQADIPSRLKVMRRDVDSKEAAGTVVAQSPGANEIVAAGRTVILDVSKGPQPDPAAGKEVFVMNCGACHTLADAGTSGTLGPNLDDSQPSEDLVVERVTNGQGAMPPFKDQLTAQQIADVAAYVSQDAGQ